MKPKIEKIEIVGFVTEVIDAKTGEYLMNFRPLRFEHVKNLEDWK